MSTTNYFSGAKGVTMNGVEIKHIEGNATTHSTNTHHNNSTKNFNIDASQNQQTTNYNNSGAGSQTVLNGGSTYNDQRGGFQPPVYPLPPYNPNLAPTGPGYPWQPPYTAYPQSPPMNGWYPYPMGPTQPPSQAPTPQHQPPTTPCPPSDEPGSGGPVNL